MEKSHDVPKLNTDQINFVFKKMVTYFKAVQRITPFWICAREKNFGFRPSFEKQFLQPNVKLWTNYLNQGFTVIVPIVFYSCEEKDIENVEDTKGKLYDPDFLVYNHYNVIVSYIDSNNNIILERYEPSGISRQGNLQDRLSDLFTNLFKQYTRKKVEFKIVAPKGLQSKYGDTRLCGHHIVYWTIYRLKYGLQQSINMLTDDASDDLFSNFCECMKNNDDIGKCLG